jgi:hypothetical protein
MAYRYGPGHGRRENAWLRVKDELLTKAKDARWSEKQRVAIKQLATAIGEGDPPSKVEAYIKALAALSPGGIEGAEVFRARCKLVVYLDRHAYDGKPLSALIDPVELVRERAGNKKFDERLERWGERLPSDLAHFATRQPASETGARVQNALLAVAKLLPQTAEIPKEFEELIDAIRTGEATLNPMHDGLMALVWPLCPSGYPEMLTAKEAIKLLRDSAQVSISEKTLRERCRDDRNLKPNTKYSRDALLEAAQQGRFDHGNKKKSSKHGGSAAPGAKA